MLCVNNESSNHVMHIIITYVYITRGYGALLKKSIIYGLYYMAVVHRGWGCHQKCPEIACHTSRIVHNIRLTAYICKNVELCFIGSFFIQRCTRHWWNV